MVARVNSTGANLTVDAKSLDGWIKTEVINISTITAAIIIQNSVPCSLANNRA
jgi:hypothetical protein